MPNGGPTPDCVHCKAYRGHPISNQEPFCAHHSINLPSPIRAFCANFADADPDGIDWLDQLLDRGQLDTDKMYVWLGGYDEGFRHVQLTTIAAYSQWTYQKFLEEIAKLT